MIDGCRAENEIRGGQLDELTLIVVLADARQFADLTEGARIDDCLDAFTYGQLAKMMLTGNLLFPTHCLGEGVPMTQFFKCFIPGH